ncbi:MAG: DinB family protein [Chloroflexota bacterium]
MNTILTAQIDILHQTQAIRTDLMNTLADADLAYKLPGGNPTLGELCRESGQVEQSYIEAFKTFKQSFAYPAVDPQLETSVDQLKGWYQQLDAELEAVLLALSDEQIQNQSIDRGWPVQINSQFHIYREALLIFYAKASCTLRAMGKALPPQMSAWIG